MPKTYSDWGDGKKHSIPLAKHKKNVKTKRAARLNDPARFTAPRGATDVNRDANTSANLRYGDVERNQALQGQQIPAWFQSYRDQVSGIAQGVRQGYDQAIKDVGARAAAGDAAGDKSRQALGSSMQADAAKRGATVDPSLLAGDANAQAVRGQGQQAFANLLTAQREANSTYFGGQQQVGSASELQQKTRLAADVKGTAADKGAYKSEYVTSARDSERKYGLERSAFGLDVAKAEADVKTDRAKIKVTKGQNKARQRDKDQDQGLARDRLKTQKEKIAYDRAHPKKSGGKGLTPAQRAARIEKWGKATSRATDAGSRWTLYKKHKNKEGKRPGPAAIKERLIKEGFSTEEIHVGWLIEHGKPFSAKDRAIARRLKIRVPKQPKYKPTTTTADPKYGMH